MRVKFFCPNAIASKPNTTCSRKSGKLQNGGGEQIAEIHLNTLQRNISILMFISIFRIRFKNYGREAIASISAQ